MNNLYLITTAIEQSDSPQPILNRCFCITTPTELEAAALALTNQPDQAFIFSIEVYRPQHYLHALRSDRPASLLHAGSLCDSTGRKRKRHFCRNRTNQSINSVRLRQFYKQQEQI